MVLQWVFNLVPEETKLMPTLALIHFNGPQTDRGNAKRLRAGTFYAGLSFYYTKFGGPSNRQVSLSPSSLDL